MSQFRSCYTSAPATLRNSVLTLISVLALTGCGESPPAWRETNPQPTEADLEVRLKQESPGQFYGYTKTNQRLRNRLFPADSRFSLRRYLGGEDTQLTELLGYSAGNGLNQDFRSGRPNAVNMTIWYIALQGLADELATFCYRNETEFPATSFLRPEAESDFQPICAWPAPEAKTETSLLKFWHRLLAFDAPRSEFEAWSTFVSKEFADTDVHEALPKMVLAALYNPHFLIAH